MAAYRCLRGESVSTGNQGPVPSLHYKAVVPATVMHASFFFGSAAVGTLQLCVIRGGVILILKEVSRTWDGPIGTVLQPGDALETIVVTPGAGNIDVSVSLDEHNPLGND